MAPHLIHFNLTYAVVERMRRKIQSLKIKESRVQPLQLRVLTPKTVPFISD